MNTNKKTEKIVIAFIGIFLLSYFMMLFDFNNLLTVFLGGCICLLIWIKQRKIDIGIGNCFLVITIMSYYIIRFGVKEAIFMGLPYVGIVMALLGVCLSREARNRADYEKIMYTLLFLLIFGFSIHGFLNVYMFYVHPLESSRIWYDFWMGVVLPATEQIVYFLPVLSIFLPSILFFQNKKIINLFYLLSASFFVYFSWITNSRMPIVMLPLVMMAQAFLYVIIEKEKIIKFYKVNKKWVVVLAIAIVICLCCFVLTENSILIILKEKMSRDGGILGNVRFEAQRLAMKQLFEYPMGGSHMWFGKINFAHNTWLDMANRAGLIPFFAFVVYTIISACELIGWIEKNEISTERKLITAGVYGIFFLYYTVERGIEGSMHFMTPWFFVNGMIHGELSIIKNR